MAQIRKCVDWTRMWRISYLLSSLHCVGTCNARWLTFYLHFQGKNTIFQVNRTSACKYTQRTGRATENEGKPSLNISKHLTFSAFDDVIFYYKKMLHFNWQLMMYQSCELVSPLRPMGVNRGSDVSRCDGRPRHNWRRWPEEERRSTVSNGLQKSRQFPSKARAKPLYKPKRWQRLNLTGNWL